MPGKILTTTGYRDIIDKKLSNGDGAFRTISKTVVIQTDTFRTAWTKPIISERVPERRIAHQNGARVITYTDEMGTAINAQAPAVIGTKETGTLYYCNADNYLRLYKMDLGTGVVTLARTNIPVLVVGLVIYPETLAAVLLSASSYYIKAYTTPNIETGAFSARVVGQLSCVPQYWFNNRILIKRTIYDTSFVTVARLTHADFTVSSFCLNLFGDHTTGYYVSGENVLVTCPAWGKVYKLENNYTLTEVMKVDDVPGLMNDMYRNVVYDPWNNRAIVAQNNGANISCFATDGTTVTHLPGVGADGIWRGHQHPPTGISLSWRGFYNARTQESGNGSQNALFPGFQSTEDNVKWTNNSLNDHAFVNNNYLWDIL